MSDYLYQPSIFDNIDLQWFSAEDEGRTEDPSELKLRKAREEGRIPKSQDLTSSIVFLVTVLVLIFCARQILIGLSNVMTFCFQRVCDKNISWASFTALFFNEIIRLVLPISLSGLVTGFLSNIAQNKGFIFTLKTIQPKFNKIIPKFGEYFKNTLFSAKGLFNVVKSIGKVAIIIIIAYLCLSRDIPLLLMSIKNANTLEALSYVSKMSSQLLVIASVLFILIAIPDYFVQKREFMESMKMTKYEQKQEYKEMEGDPEIKSRLESEQRRILAQNMPKAVKEADVLITNPTHFAVSMKYDATVADAPKVTAKGCDEIAFEMRRIATENNVPIVENRPLARSLYTDTEVGDVIPDKYLRVLADIYAEVLKYSSKKNE